MKFVFVTGGVVSSLGKGITAASLGRLLKCRGYRVAMQKFDPYINVDPGMMSPYQHGEAFVTDDGGVCDLDIGHYERFIDENCSKLSDLTTGYIYNNIITREQRGEFNGSTVQVIPHITNEIKRCMTDLARNTDADVVIVEVGGTVGDIEGLPYLEAIRQMRYDRKAGVEAVCYVHVTLVPYLRRAGEIKTKPTQHSVKQLLSIGIQPDVVVLRTEVPIDASVTDKVELFCNLDRGHVVQNIDADSLYEVPLLLHEQGLDSLVCQTLGLSADTPPDLTEWRGILQKQLHRQNRVKVALVGKYVELNDAYLSICEALEHAGIALGLHVDVTRVSSELITAETAGELLGGAAAIIMPHGWGQRGTSGMIEAARYARVHGVPLLASGLAAQMAVASFARDVCDMPEAHSMEVAPQTPFPVVAPAPGQTGALPEMRQGACPCTLVPGSLCAEVYGQTAIRERHRHRYEFNQAYVPKLEACGLKCAGYHSVNGLVEVFELAGHPFYVLVQFCPEFTSRPNRPHPLMLALLGACVAGRTVTPNVTDEG